MFRNLRFYRITTPWPNTEEKLSEVLSCVMSEDGVFSKLRFTGGDAVGIPDYEDSLARLDVIFVLLTGFVGRMVSDLKKSLGGYA